MNRRSLLKLALGGACPWPALARGASPKRRQRQGRIGETAVPFTYCIDYGIDHVENPRFVETVAAAPPHLLHLGHELAFKSAVGPRDVPLPVKNSGRYHRLNPRETRALRDATGNLVRRLHQAGVEVVIPYIDNQQMGGDAERRSGFWEFYDHWDDYRELGLPPKPPVDPIHWMQRDPDGHTVFNEPKAYLAYRPDSFYAPCPNNEHWRRWLAFVVEQAALIGFDGVFVDNNILHCYCAYCRTEFHRYLATRYTPRELQQNFGASDPGKLDLHWAADRTWWALQQPGFRDFLLRRHKPGEFEERFQVKDLSSLEEINTIGSGYLQGRAREFIAQLGDKYTPPGLGRPADRLLWYDTQRFWAWSIAEHLLLLQQAAEKHKPGFLILPNWGAMGTIANVDGRRLYGKNVEEWSRGCHSMMFEENGMPGRDHDYVLQYKFALANGVRPVVLPYGPYNEANLELGMAEAAAGGGGAFVQGGYGFPMVRRRYRAFFEERPALFDGLEPLSHVALAFFFYQLHYENVDHLRHVYRLKKALAERHLLFDCLRERDLARSRLDRYRAVILPSVDSLQDRDVATLTDWVRAGGLLVATGNVPAFPPRTADAALPEALNKLAAVEGGGLASVKVNVYWKRLAGETRIVIHVVNYDLAACDVPFSILLPSGAPSEVRDARAFTAGEPPVTIAVRIENGALKLIVPHVRIYRIVEVVLGGRA